MIDFTPNRECIFIFVQNIYYYELFQFAERLVWIVIKIELYIEISFWLPFIEARVQWRNIGDGERLCLHIKSIYAWWLEIVNCFFFCIEGKTGMVKLCSKKDN